MSIDFRLPNINAESQQGQITQMKSYLHQLVSELNWALNSIEVSSENAIEIIKSSSSAPLTDEEANNTFNSIKELIIKSADIVNAYYDQINARFAGAYVAQSDFGTYTEQKLHELHISPDDISSTYYNKQTVDAIISEISQESNAWIRTGHIDDDGDVPIYGIEVGQKTVRDGVEVFNKYARFTADGIFFYLPGTNSAVAWMSGTKLYITNAEVTNSLKLGKYICDLSSGVAFKWIGG